MIPPGSSLPNGFKLRMTVLQGKVVAFLSLPYGRLFASDLFFFLMPFCLLDWRPLSVFFYPSLERRLFFVVGALSSSNSLSFPGAFFFWVL